MNWHSAKGKGDQPDGQTGVVTVVERLDTAATGPVQAGHVDRPKLGPAGAALTVAGWALEADGPVPAVEVVGDGGVIATTTPGHRRPDVAQAHPTIPRADESGFQLAIPTQSLVNVQKLEVFAVSNDGTKTQLAVFGLDSTVGPGIDTEGEPNKSRLRRWMKGLPAAFGFRGGGGV